MNILNINKYIILLFLSIVCFSCSKTNISNVPHTDTADTVTIPIKIGFNGLVKLHSQNTLESDDETTVVASPLPSTPIKNVAIFVADSNGKIISSGYYDNIPVNNIITHKTYEVKNATVICMVNWGNWVYNKVKKDDSKNPVAGYFMTDTNFPIVHPVTTVMCLAGESEPVNIISSNQNPVHVKCKHVYSKLDIVIKIKKNRNIHLNGINMFNVSKVMSYIPHPLLDDSYYTPQQIPIPSSPSTSTGDDYDEYKIGTLCMGDNWAGAGSGPASTLSGSAHTLQERAKYAPARATYIEIATSVGSPDMLTGNNYYKARIYLGDISKLNEGKSDYNVKPGYDNQVTVTINDYDNINADSRVNKSNVIFKYLVDASSSDLNNTIKFTNGFKGFVDWGDGSDVTPNAASPSGALTHYYKKEGLYVVNVYGEWMTGKTVCDLQGSNNVTLLSLGGSATGFQLKSSIPRINVNKDFFQASSNTLLDLSKAFNNVNIVTIPPGLLNNCTKVTDLSHMFEMCRGLTSSIPTGLLDNCTQVTDLSNMFYDCPNLTGSIPRGLLDHCEQVTNLSSMFNMCGKLTGSIPTGLLDHCDQVTELNAMFTECMNLTGSIPTGLLDHCAQVTNLSGLFYDCRGLTSSIPTGLLDHCTYVTDLSNMFSACGALTGSIPPGLLNNCTQVNDLHRMFNKCVNLTGSIPRGLLDHCAQVKYLYKMFSECKNLTGSIPTGLLDYCTQVTNLSYMFELCGSLTGSIPTGLLDHCTYVTNLSYMFAGCKNLTGSLRLPRSVSNNNNWNAGSRINKQ